MDHRVDVDQPVAPVNGIENAPVSNRIFIQSRQIVHCLVAKVFSVGSDPFRLIKEPLSHERTGGGKVLDDACLECQSIPGH